MSIEIVNGTGTEFVIVHINSTVPLVVKKNESLLYTGFIAVAVATVSGVGYDITAAVNGTDTLLRYVRAVTNPETSPILVTRKSGRVVTLEAPIAPTANPPVLFTNNSGLVPMFVNGVANSGPPGSSFFVPTNGTSFFADMQLQNVANYIVHFSYTFDLSGPDGTFQANCVSDPLAVPCGSPFTVIPTITKAGYNLIVNGITVSQKLRQELDFGGNFIARR